MSITFTDSAKKEILKIFGMFTDNKGYIVQCVNGKDKRVKTRKGEEIHIDEFGGIHKGFGIFKGDLGSLIELSDYIKSKEKKK
jgi:hypothetical protein